MTLSEKTHWYDIDFIKSLTFPVPDLLGHIYWLVPNSRQLCCRHIQRRTELTTSAKISPGRKNSLFKTTLAWGRSLLMTVTPVSHMTLISWLTPPTETLFPNKRLPPSNSRPQIPLLIWKTPNLIYIGNILALTLSLCFSPFTRRLVFNVFQRTSANYHRTSWDFHLAQLITLSSQVHYHIPPLKKCIRHCATVSVCVLV